jgi:hypothetical protein
VRFASIQAVGNCSKQGTWSPWHDQGVREPMKIRAWGAIGASVFNEPAGITTISPPWRGNRAPQLPQKWFSKRAASGNRNFRT